jgi:hypothetical protein
VKGMGNSPATLGVWAAYFKSGGDGIAENSLDSLILPANIQIELLGSN